MQNSDDPHLRKNKHNKTKIYFSIQKDGKSNQLQAKIKYIETDNSQIVLPERVFSHLKFYPIIFDYDQTVVIKNLAYKIMLNKCVFYGSNGKLGCPNAQVLKIQTNEFRFESLFLWAKMLPNLKDIVLHNNTVNTIGGVPFKNVDGQPALAYIPQGRKQFALTTSLLHFDESNQNIRYGYLNQAENPASKLFSLYANTNLKTLSLDTQKIGIKDLPTLYLWLSKCQVLEEIKIEDNQDFCVKHNLVYAKRDVGGYKKDDLLLCPQGLKEVKIASGVRAINSNILKILPRDIEILEIPETVMDIDWLAVLNGPEKLNNLKEIKVSPNNPYFCSMCGIVFKKHKNTHKKHEALWVPPKLPELLLMWDFDLQSLIERKNELQNVGTLYIPADDFNKDNFSQICGIANCMGKLSDIVVVNNNISGKPPTLYSTAGVLYSNDGKQILSPYAKKVVCLSPSVRSLKDVEMHLSPMVTDLIVPENLTEIPAGYFDKYKKIQTVEVNESNPAYICKNNTLVDRRTNQVVFQPVDKQENNLVLTK